MLLSQRFSPTRPPPHCPLLLSPALLRARARPALSRSPCQPFPFAVSQIASSSSPRLKLFRRQKRYTAPLFSSTIGTFSPVMQVGTSKWGGTVSDTVEPCPVEWTLYAIGGKWKCLIL